MVEGLSSNGGSVLRLAVVYVVLERVNGWEVRVAVGSLAVCCVEWLGFCWSVMLRDRCDIALGGLVRW